MKGWFTASERTSFPFSEEKNHKCQQHTDVDTEEEPVIRIEELRRERGSLQEVGGERRLHLCYSRHSADGGRLCSPASLCGKTRLNKPTEDFTQNDLWRLFLTSLPPR